MEITKEQIYDKLVDLEIMMQILLRANKSEKFKILEEETKELKEVLKIKKSQVHQSKEELEKLIERYNKHKKTMKLLNRISKLVSSGLLHDSSLKHETIILLKVADKLSQEKLDYHLSETMKIISKRFAQ